MATNKDDILKAIEEMSVMDLVDLISACLLYTSPSPRDED